MWAVEAQHQIKRCLSTVESVARVSAMIESAPGIHRTELARGVCEEFGFRDARGRPQTSGCLAALRGLERGGLLRLPAARTGGGSCVRGGPPLVVAPARGVPKTAGQVSGLWLAPVESVEHRAVWHGLLAREHPRGAGPLVGCRLRYLVGSDHGWLGAAGFASAALHLSARDRWIGWDATTRRAHLHRVVGLSRFLIRAGVDCRNLASHVLGQLLRRLPADFEARYGHVPYLVETFVDGAHDGASLRASNWRRLGETAGRGRQDRGNAALAGRKRVYVCELTADWRWRRRRAGAGDGSAGARRGS